MNIKKFMNIEPPKNNSDKTMDKFFSVANPITCSSEEGIIHLADRCQRVFSLKKEL